MSYKRMALVVSLALLLAVALGGCGTLRSLFGRPAEVGDSEWILQSLNGKPLVEDSNITLSFDKGRAGGYAGCNWYGWNYRPSGPTPQVPEVTITVRLCSEPAGVMEQEQEYVEALRQMKAFEVQGDRLLVKDAEDEAILVFQRRQALPLDPAKLVGTRWQLQTMAGESLLDGSQITLRFDRAGQVRATPVAATIALPMRPRATTSASPSWRWCRPIARAAMRCCGRRASIPRISARPRTIVLLKTVSSC